MQEELINLWTAMRAKEKGFNELCSYGFNQVGYELIKMPNANSENVLISAPTQALLQRWLREKHHINIIVFNDDGALNNKNLRFNFELRSITVSFRVKQKECTVGMYDFKKYEEALEAGLQEALKLILSEQFA